MSLKVAVVCGGASAEADVSRKSAAGVVAALKAARHTATLHELDNRLFDALLAERPDVVFPMAHGTLGEDGCLQGLLEVLNLPYVGSGVLASALATDKPMVKHVWRTHGLPVAPDAVVTRHENPLHATERIRTQLGPALVVKPAHGGSAIGVYLVGADQPNEAVEQAIVSVLQMDEAALVEPMLTGLEVTCAVLEDIPLVPVALPLTLIVPKRAGFYDFASKYAPGGSQHVCPAPLAAATTVRVQEFALRAHRLIGARDMSRVDFFVNEQVTPTDITLLEINTLPGMTATSLYPEAAAAHGVDFPTLCDRLVSGAKSRPVREVPQVEMVPNE